MKKECEDIRKRLPRFLRGHVFRWQARRVEAHLADCPFCRSERDALRRAEETRAILHDVGPSYGPARGLVLRLSWATRLLYRPLWLAAAVAVAIAGYLFVVRPFLHDPDLERLDAAGPVAHSASEKSPPSPPQPARDEAPGAPVSPPSALPPSVEPLIVTITMNREGEKAAIRRINEAMKEHALLKTMRLSDSVREISGNLTAGELYTFFTRIQDVGKITYKRSRLAAADSATMLPFIMRLNVAAPVELRQAPEQAVHKPVENQGEKPVENRADRTGERPVDAAADRPAVKPEDRTAPASPPAQ